MFRYLSDVRTLFLLLIPFVESAHTYKLSNPIAEIKICDLASLVADVTDSHLEVYAGTNPDLKPGFMPSTVPKLLPIIAKVQALGWEPAVDLYDGFKRILFSWLCLNTTS